MSQSSDAARQQADKDFEAGKSPTNTAGWEATRKAAYDDQMQRRQQEQQRRK